MTEREYVLEHETTHALILVRGRNGHLVEPELRRLVGMNVMKCRDEAHDLAGVDCHNKVMTRIVQELGRQVRLWSVIEDAGRDVREQSVVTRP